MFEKIPVPVKGQPARASWGAGITNRVNELCSMVPSRGLARDGLTGTGFAPLPANLRDRRGSAAKIPGRFEITLTADEMPEGSEPEEQTYTATFKNPYYDIGGKTYEMTAEGESDAVTLEGIKDGSIICLIISAGEIITAELEKSGSLAELRESQQDVTRYSTPLYKISGGSVVCDFRNGPVFVMGEF